MAEKKKTWVFSLNPSVDVEWKVPHVLWEEKNNILSERRWAGGKGVNVARWFQLLSADTSHRACLALPLGGLTGQEMRGYLESDGFWVREIPIAESTRANIIITTEEKNTAAASRIVRWAATVIAILKCGTTCSASSTMTATAITAN